MGIDQNLSRITIVKNMSAYKVLLICCLLISLGLEIEARGAGGGRNRGRGGWKKSGNQGHPLRNHLNPTWSGFDRFVAPSVTSGEPVQVEVNMYMREVGPMNLEDNSFALQLTLRQVFNDTRLAYRTTHRAPEYITLTGEEIDTIWQPDTFIRNDRGVLFHESLVSYTTPNMYARVYPDGSIQTSQRVTLKLSCPRLNSQLKESGEANCPMDIASYGYREDDLKYVWKGDHPVQTNPGYEGFVVPTSAGVKMKIPTAERCDVVTSTGKYSCLRLQMVFFKE